MTTERITLAKKKNNQEDEDLSKFSVEELEDRLYDEKLDGRANQDKRKPLREELKKRGAR